MVSGHGGEVQLQLRYHVELEQSERAVSRGIPGCRVPGYASRRSRPTRRVSDVHGAWRRMDGVSLRGLCPDTLSIPGELGLVSQHISRRGIVREQHLETDVR